MNQFSYNESAASGYNRAFEKVSAHFIPFLLQAGRLAHGHRVLDIATGTGIGAQAALAAVGPTGHVTAADLSPTMVERARKRLGDASNVTYSVEDGQALSFPDASFDAVLCSLGLMFFPDPMRGLLEFRRVLRLGGRAAISVNTVPERSYNTRLHLAIGKYNPSLAEAAARIFSLGAPARLRTLFQQAGFQDVEVRTELHRFVEPSFDAYFEPYEQGGGSNGAAFVALPEDQRRMVREDLRQAMGDTGGPLEIDVEFAFASGRR
jgi:ubiquinone/menaquinone biosynthesis C-methylase UbiE